MNTTSPNAPSSTEAATEKPTTPKATWESLGLSEESLDLIRKAGFTSPTPVQAESLPIVIEGHDLIASAQTGTGKTAGFVLPMVERIAGRQGTYGLILAPTRELAQQTAETLDLFGTPRGVRHCVLIGGVDMRHDAAALATYPQIIVATPGRLCDHLDRGNVWLDFIEVVVLDEADRMLDMGFADQINRIFQDLPEKRQTLLFSATIPPMVERLASKILHEPKRVAIGKPLSAAKTVEQKLLWMKEDSKVRELHRMLRKESGSIIIFTRSKDGASRLWRTLHSSGVYDATFIHSDRRQSDREQALADFKAGKFRVLIATDVAGRGIHVDDVALVINYDMPMDPEEYVHRIGRTGRKEAAGNAVSFVTPRDRGIVGRIEKLIGKHIPAESMDGVGSEPGPHGDRGDRGGHGRGGQRGGGGRGGEHRGGERREHREPRQQAQAGEGAQAAQPREGSGPGAAGEGGKRQRRGRRGGRGRRKPGGGGAPQG